MYVYTGYMEEIGNSSAGQRVAYSLRETAVASGKTYTAVHKQVRAGNIPTVRLGTRHLVPASYWTAHSLSLPAAEKDNS